MKRHAAVILALVATLALSAPAAARGHRSSGGHAGGHSGGHSGSHAGAHSGAHSSGHAGGGAHSPAGHSPSHAHAGTRDHPGHIERDRHQRDAFQHANPCPSTGKASGACPGYVVDHVVPLKRGGPDAPSNMQWQTTQAAKAKDRTE